MSDEPKDVRLTIRAEPGGEGPPMVRLRRAIKALSRWFGWRCLKVEEIDPETKEKHDG